MNDETNWLELYTLSFQQAFETISVLSKCVSLYSSITAQQKAISIQKHEVDALNWLWKHRWHNLDGLSAYQFSDY